MYLNLDTLFMAIQAFCLYHNAHKIIKIKIAFVEEVKNIKKEFIRYKLTADINPLLKFFRQVD